MDSGTKMSGDSTTELVILSPSKDYVTKDTSTKSSVLNDATLNMALTSTSAITLQSKPVTELSTPESPVSLPLIQSSYTGYLSTTEDFSVQNTLAVKSSPVSIEDTASLPEQSLKTQIKDIKPQMSSVLHYQSSQMTPTSHHTFSSSAKVTKSQDMGASAMRQIQISPSSTDASFATSLKSPLSLSPVIKTSSDISSAKFPKASSQLSSVQKRSVTPSLSLTLSYTDTRVTMTDISPTKPPLQSSSSINKLNSGVTVLNTGFNQSTSVKSAPVTPLQTNRVSVTPTVVPPIHPVSPTQTPKGSGSLNDIPVYVPGKNSPMMTSALVPVSTSVVPSIPPTPETALGESLPFILGVSLSGVGLILFITVFAVFCCCRKKSSKNNKEEIRTHDLWVSTTATSDVGLSPTADPLPGFESITETILTEYRKSLSNGQKVIKPKRRKVPLPVLKRDSSSDDVTYRALHSYDVTQEGQLAFNKGEIITVLEKTNDGWWKGTIGDREGWFPGSFVKEVRPKANSSSGGDDQKEDDAEDENRKPRVSSFLLSKDQRPRSLHLPRNQSDRYSPVRQLSPKRDSWALGKEVSIPRVPYVEKKVDNSVDGHSAGTLKDSGLLSSTGGKRYQVLYNYAANFKSEISLQKGEVIIGIERDKNGWMKGQKEKTREEGWFPAVYVQEYSSLSSPVTGLVEDTEVYKKLLVDTNNSKLQEVVCIEHLAVCPFAAEKEHDLSFDIGDTILVFDTLENGWWLGCHGDDVGWFPGAYVQIVTDGKNYVDEYGNTKDTQDMVRGSSALPNTSNISASQLSVRSDDNLSVSSDMSGRGRVGSDINTPGGLSTFSAAKSDRSASTLSVQSRSDDDVSMSSATGTIDSKSSSRRIKPKRKAPKPPVDSPGGSKLPTPIKPTRQAPAPPGQNHSTPEQRGISDVLGGTVKQETQLTKVISEFPKVEISIIRDPPENKPKKPEIPKRFVKPKLVKVPRRKLDMKKVSDQKSRQIARSPPPPRPPPPKVSLQSPSSTLTTPNITAEETNSLENLSAYLSSTSGVSQTEDQSGSLYKDIDVTSLSANVSVPEIPPEEPSQSQHVVPKLQRQNALQSESKAVEVPGDNDGVVDTDIIDNNQCVVDGHVNEETCNEDNLKPDVSSIPPIPQFNGLPNEQVVPITDNAEMPCLDTDLPINTNGYGEAPASPVGNVRNSMVLLESPSIKLCDPPDIVNKTDEVDSANVPDHKGDRTDNVESSQTKIPKARPPVAPKPKGIPQPKIHYRPDTSSEEVKVNPENKISQESPSTKRKGSNQRSKSSSSPSREEPTVDKKNITQESPASRRKALGQRSRTISSPARDVKSGIPVSNSPTREVKSGIPVHSSPTREVKSGIPVHSSPTREVKSGIPVNKSSAKEVKSGIPVNNKSPKKSPRNKSNERAIPVRQNSGENSKLQNRQSENNSQNKPQRPNKPPDPSKQPKSKTSSSSPSRLPKLASSGSSTTQAKDEDNKVISPPKQGKRSIPVAKPARPPPPKSPPTSPVLKMSAKGDNQPDTGFYSFGKTNGVHSGTSKPQEDRSLRKTVRAYKGQHEGELSFEEGSFIMEISQDEDNPGWYLGMLADGSTGLYHSSFIEETPGQQHTVV